MNQRRRSFVPVSRKQIIMQFTFCLFTRFFQNNALMKTDHGLPRTYNAAQDSRSGISVFICLTAKFILQNQTELTKCKAKVLNVMTMHFPLINRHANRILTAPYSDHQRPIGVCLVSRYYLVNGTTWGGGERGICLFGMKCVLTFSATSI